MEAFVPYTTKPKVRTLHQLLSTTRNITNMPYVADDLTSTAAHAHSPGLKLDDVGVVDMLRVSSPPFEGQYETI